LFYLHCKCPVAPCAGAWIETGHGYFFPRFIRVAPCAGAWIETFVYESLDLNVVAPCAGAWIETDVKHLR